MAVIERPQVNLGNLGRNAFKVCVRVLNELDHKRFIPLREKFLRESNYAFIKSLPTDQTPTYCFDVAMKAAQAVCDVWGVGSAERPSAPRHPAAM